MDVTSHSYLIVNASRSHSSANQHQLTLRPSPQPSPPSTGEREQMPHAPRFLCESPAESAQHEYANPNPTPRPDQVSPPRIKRRPRIEHDLVRQRRRVAAAGARRVRRQEQFVVRAAVGVDETADAGVHASGHRGAVLDAAERGALQVLIASVPENQPSLVMLTMKSAFLPPCRPPRQAPLRNIHAPRSPSMSSKQIGVTNAPGRRSWHFFCRCRLC